MDFKLIKVLDEQLEFQPIHPPKMWILVSANSSSKDVNLPIWTILNDIETVVIAKTEFEFRVAWCLTAFFQKIGWNKIWCKDRKGRFFDRIFPYQNGVFKLDIDERNRTLSYGGTSSKNPKELLWIDFSEFLNNHGSDSVSILIDFLASSPLQLLGVLLKHYRKKSKQTSPEILHSKKEKS